MSIYVLLFFSEGAFSLGIEHSSLSKFWRNRISWKWAIILGTSNRFIFLRNSHKKCSNNNSNVSNVTKALEGIQDTFLFMLLPAVIYHVWPELKSVAPWHKHRRSETKQIFLRLQRRKLSFMQSSLGRCPELYN